MSKTLKPFLYVIIILIGAHFLSYLFIGSYKKWCLVHYLEFKITSESIVSPKAQDSLLSSFATRSFVELNPMYISQTESDQSPFKSFLSKKKYYHLDRQDLFKKIVGDHRIIEFVPKDEYLSKCILSEDSLYWLMSQKVLSKFIELENELRSLNLDLDQIKVNNGYRYPLFNKQIGGASRSRHIHGEAIDLYIGDINEDGLTDSIDKQIVLDLVDQKIIGNKGGVGLYPGTQVVHIDTRGHRARWNSY